MQGNITLTIIKPGAVQNEYIGPILHKIHDAGFHIAALRLTRLNRKQAEEFYSVHKERPFYGDLVEFMISGPIVVAILEKANAVEDYRKLIGSTDPVRLKKELSVNFSLNRCRKMRFMDPTAMKMPLTNVISSSQKVNAFTKMQINITVFLFFMNAGYMYRLK